MKRLNAWLLGLSVVVIPAFLAFSADGDAPKRGDKPRDVFPAFKGLSLTADQEDKIRQLRKDHERQIRELNEKFHADVMAVLTPDQIAEFKGSGPERPGWKKGGEGRGDGERKGGAKPKRDQGDARPEGKTGGKRPDDARDGDRMDKLLREVERLNRELDQLRHEVKGMEKSESR